MKKILLILSILFLLPISACSKTDAQVEKEEVQTTVRVALVQNKQMVESSTFSGLLKAGKKSVLSADLPGEIQDMLVNPGDYVIKGQKLALIGDSQGNYELDISKSSSDKLLLEMENTLKDLVEANLQAVDYAQGNIEAARISSEKARIYAEDLKNTFLAQIEQAKTQVAKAGISYNIAKQNYENYLKKSQADKLAGSNQVFETASYIDLLRTQLDNQKDLNDEQENQAEKAIDNANDSLDYAEENLADLRADSTATSAQISAAEFAVRQARSQVDMAENELDKLKEQINSSEDNLKNQIDVANIQYDGSSYSRDSSDLEIDNQLKILKYSEDLAQQGLEEANTSLTLLQTQLKQSVNTAEASYREAQNQFINLNKSLTLTQKQGAVAESELKTKIEELKGQLSILESRIENKYIVAPFDGTISKQFLDVGSMVNTGTPILEITNSDVLKAEWYMPESKVSTVTRGQTVLVNIDNEVITAEIKEIEPSSSKFSKKVRIEADINSNDLFIIDNTYIEVEIQSTSENNYLMIPLSALQARYKDNFVFVEDNGLLELRRIEVGDISNGEIVVTSGLEIGENVVINPAKNLSDQLRVNVENA